MHHRVFCAVFTFAFLIPTIPAQQAAAPNDSTSLTIYNGDFAVASTAIELSLQPGINDLSTTKVTNQLEPDSVLLTDKAGRATFKILEQNYDSGAGSQEKPKPALRWQIESEKAQNITAELAYITGGLSWQAAYNAIVPDAADAGGNQRADIQGWVTINNQSGTDFAAARIKLMDVDVAKTQEDGFRVPRQIMSAGMQGNTEAEEMQIGQRSFDDFHLYDLDRTIHLGDGEVKQLQFLSAGGVGISRAYVYDGAATNRQPIYAGRVIEEQEYGLDETRTKVNIAEEIKNTSANHLGTPLPSGRMRLYRRNSDGETELVGESVVPRTPADSSISVISGEALDMRGARTQTDFHLSGNGRTLDETIQVKLTNQRSQPVAVNVIEHLYRGNTWEITDKSAEYTKIDSHTIQFANQVPAKGESTLTYSVRYSW